MTDICIVFDRLRSEEKMLKKEAELLGHHVMMVDAKSASFDTCSVRGEYGDVVLERCVSYFRGLHFTACLESAGVKVVNSFEVAARCGNKMFMTLALQGKKVPTPRTYFAFSKDAAMGVAEEAGYPLVIKPVIGSWGRGVMPVRDRDAMDAVIESREITDTPHDRIYYLQELVRRPPRDIRVVTVGGEPLAAMYRRSSGGFKTNVALGAEPEPCKITSEMGELASRASEAAGGGILGIDMMEDESRGLVVTEVNNTVEFRGISRVSERNIPREIARYAAGMC
ncbi:glutathione synthase/ribosomal protein S6 modification enzyme (glutaminyl transferase) [Cenarchaeum symbiosum A]|uniref:Glutathione synthase/ribosomal protein S6 modification enzyme (Glutaminyl transferase) n=1 Tax=Cenarchaeum symbiosum (strain A) TaxID=414004 RepID=A0RW42_CENSY|nr:glutathione synthase/ribosomal protein S6 modification enzyme (glutaminyl transferase) [Cenarchaeum symbiosum A]